MENKSKDFKEKRFDFTVYVNDNIIAKRNFSIFNFVEGSMCSLEFKDTVDAIVNMIDEDLKSKSRVYMWHFYNPERPNDSEELVSPLIEPWTYTFKIVISDNKRDVITKIWDGRYYPKYIRERVDLSNRSVKIVTKDGKSFSYEKEEFFKEREGKLTFEQELIKGMISDKSDVLQAIIKMICDTCAPDKEETDGIRISRKDNAKYLANYTTKDVFENDDKSIKGKTYIMDIDYINHKTEKDFEKLTKDKTKEYFDSLYV